jgi:hypothetical protein
VRRDGCMESGRELSGAFRYVDKCSLEGVKMRRDTSCRGVCRGEGRGLEASGSALGALEV